MPATTMRPLCNKVAPRRWMPRVCAAADCRITIVVNVPYFATTPILCWLVTACVCSQTGRESSIESSSLSVSRRGVLHSVWLLTFVTLCVRQLRVLAHRVRLQSHWTLRLGLFGRLASLRSVALGSSATPPTLPQASSPTDTAIAPVILGSATGDRCTELPNNRAAAASRCTRVGDPSYELRDGFDLMLCFSEGARPDVGLLTLRPTTDG